MLTVKEVEILGQKFPVRYDINALGELEDLTGQNTLSRDLTFNMKMLRALAYVGLKHGHKYQFNGQSQYTKSIDEVGAWLPIKDLSLFIPIFKDFTSSGDSENSTSTPQSESMGELIGANLEN